MALLTLTSELLAECVLYLDPVDASALSCTCKSLKNWLDASNNPHIWRMMFLQLFDPVDSSTRPGYRYDPPLVIQSASSSPSPTEIDYASLTKKRCRARGIVRSPHSDKRAKHRESTIRSLYDIYLSANCRGRGTSKNAAFLAFLLTSKSSIADWLTVSPLPPPSPVMSHPPRSPDAPVTRSMSNSPPQFPVQLTPSETPEIRNMISHLHLAGTSLREVSWQSYKSGQRFRETVYKGSNFGEAEQFGPFKVSEDGKKTVNWTLVDAIAQVMALNTRSAWDQWAYPHEMDILPYGFEKAVFWKQPGPGRDWANVEGSWAYMYAFIDYSDYFAFNFASSALADVRVRPITLDGVSEAVGGMNYLVLKLTDDPDGEKMDSESQAGDEEEDLYPTLHFAGKSTGPQGSTFRGRVSLMEDGNRHWTFIIRYGGSDRWQTECIEVGGRGVYGVWSDVLHEELSPSGPVWYFRA